MCAQTRTQIFACVLTSQRGLCADKYKQGSKTSGLTFVRPLVRAYACACVHACVSGEPIALSQTEKGDSTGREAEKGFGQPR